MTTAERTFSDLPETIRRPLTVGEVAAIAEVDRKVVNRMIDDGVVPKAFLDWSSKHDDVRPMRLLKHTAFPEED